MGSRSLEGGQPKIQNWLPEGQISKKVSVEHCVHFIWVWVHSDTKFRLYVFLYFSGAFPLYLQKRKYFKAEDCAIVFLKPSQKTRVA